MLATLCWCGCGDSGPLGQDTSLLCDSEPDPYPSPAFSAAVPPSSCSPFELLVPTGRPEGPTLVAARPDGSVIVFDRVQPLAGFRVIRGVGSATEVAWATIYSGLAKDRVVKSAFSTQGVDWLAGGSMRIPLVPAPEDGMLQVDLEHLTATVSSDPTLLGSDLDASFEAGERLVPVEDCRSIVDSLQVRLPALTHVLTASTPTGQTASVFKVSSSAYLQGDLWQERIVFFGNETLNQVEVTTALQEREGGFFLDFVSEGSPYTVRFPSSCEGSHLPSGCDGELTLPGGDVEKLMPMSRETAMSLAFSCQVGWRREN